MNHLVEVAALHRLLAEYLPTQRWYGEKSAAITAVEVVAGTDVALPGTTPQHYAGAQWLVVAVHGETAAPTYYQLLIGYLTGEVSHPATMAECEGYTLIDGFLDQHLAGAVLAAFVEHGELGPLRYHAVTEQVFPVSLHTRPMGVEQSNTSLVVGADTDRSGKAMVKFFRHLQPGINPDVELLTALTGVECAAIAPLRASVATTINGEDYTTAMVQDFVPNSAEGWSMALTSVRDALRSQKRSTASGQLGTDFAPESALLGKAVATVHADLQRALGGAEISRDTLVVGLQERLEAAIAAVPDLERYREQIEQCFAGLPAQLPVQRIHGDLHLGQVLRTPSQWILIDFEGEPARPLTQRREMDSPIRDIAGMLRSFDYAAVHPQREESTGGDSNAAMAEDWAERNCAAFLAGYRSVAGEEQLADPQVLRAYLLDKALYEVVYEANHRPDWVTIPTAAVSRLARAEQLPGF